MQRRQFIKLGFAGLGAYTGLMLSACVKARTLDIHPAWKVINKLSNKPDSNGILLPPGFTTRVVARSGKQVSPHSDYRWHKAPDGAGTFATPSGGWIYVSNSEVKHNKGGVGAIEFNSNGDILSAYSLLRDSNVNCGGGVTPWGSWLSSEESERGQVWECDPFGQLPAVARPALGRFAHESVAVDNRQRQLYMTEDRTDAGLYRFIPATAPSGYAKQGAYNLEQGRLQICRIDNGNSGKVTWLPVPDPQATDRQTRYQQEGSTPFAGGEGMCYHDGMVYFTTKHDNRVWRYDTRRETIDTIYDANKFRDPVLTGVDAALIGKDGSVIIAEDEGNMQVIAIRDRTLTVLLQVQGHPDSEITGIAFDPGFQRLYFSSQRGTTGHASGGVTYEMRGPF